MVMGPWQLTSEGNGQHIQLGEINAPLSAREAEMVAKEEVVKVVSICCGSSSLLPLHSCLSSLWSFLYLPSLFSQEGSSIFFQETRSEIYTDPFFNERQMLIIYIQNGLMLLIKCEYFGASKGTYCNWRV